MKILMLWRYPPTYLASFFRMHAGVEGLPFAEQTRALLDDHFGWPADLSRHMAGQGLDVRYIVWNVPSLQRKWADENGYGVGSDPGWELKVAAEQVRRFRPDVLWLPYAPEHLGDFLGQISGHCGRLLLWLACPVPGPLDLAAFSSVITSHPDLVTNLAGVDRRKIVVARPGFAPEILAKLGNVEKRGGVTFLGSVSPWHRRRAEMLAYLVERGIPLGMSGALNWHGPRRRSHRFRVAWREFRGGSSLGSAIRSLRPDPYDVHAARLHAVLRSPVFGLDMYRRLAESRVTLNVHIDVAGSVAGNMRLFEATGAGACLITEHHDNIAELFEPGREVLTFRSKRELLAVVKACLHDPEMAADIAKAGQARTLKDHTIARTWADMKGAFVP